VVIAGKNMFGEAENALFLPEWVWCFLAAKPPKNTTPTDMWLHHTTLFRGINDCGR